MRIRHDSPLRPHNPLRPQEWSSDRTEVKKPSSEFPSDKTLEQRIRSAASRVRPLDDRKA